MVTFKVNREKALDAIVVLALILNSGGNYLVRNIFIYFLICIMLLAKRKRFTKDNVKTFVALIIYFFLNICVTNTCPPIYQQLLTLVVRITGCLIIADNIGVEQFKNTYINVMKFLCIVSLFWFSLICVNIMPPFLDCSDYLYASIFQTVGFTLNTRRNAGIFGEPGLFQMYINLALVFLAYNKTIQLNKKRKIAALYAVTILSTGSAMGLIVLAVVLLILFFQNKNIYKISLPKKQKIAVFLMIAIVVLLFEQMTGTIQEFITSWNSYASRHDDTILALFITKDYPLFGVGVGNDVSELWTSYFPRIRGIAKYGYDHLDDLAQSNGLADCLFTAGIPFTLYYMYKVTKSYFNLLGVNNTFEKILFILILVLCFMNEPYMLTPFFLLMLFHIKPINTVKRFKDDTK